MRLALREVCRKPFSVDLPSGLFHRLFIGCFIGFFIGFLLIPGLIAEQSAQACGLDSSSRSLSCVRVEKDARWRGRSSRPKSLDQIVELERTAGTRTDRLPNRRNRIALGWNRRFSHAIPSRSNLARGDSPP